MEPKDYIESGMLEAYALGILPRDEAQEVERVAAADIEVRGALRRAQKALEDLASAHTVIPRPEWKAKILKNALGDDYSFEDESVVRSIAPSDTKKSSGTHWWAVAATLLLLLSLGLNFMQYNSVKDIQENLASTQLRVAQLEQQNTTLTVNYQEVKQDYQNLKGDFDVVRDPASEIFKMASTPNRDEGFRADVIFNDETKTVYLDVKNLPKAPAGKQYQLWALRGPVPVSIGVFNEGDYQDVLRKIGTVEGASDFAVTLEPEGGSEFPTLSELYLASGPLG